MIRKLPIYFLIFIQGAGEYAAEIVLLRTGLSYCLEEILKPIHACPLVSSHRGR